jgi:acid phosphatase family membrane protein YuiD
LPSSPHAIAVTSGWLALLFALALIAALPLARTVAVLRRPAGSGR